jgi:FkbM family methyltransferase
MSAYEAFGIQITFPEEVLTPVIRKMLEKGWYEVEEANAIRHNLRDGDRVLEIGGGVGFLATLCSSIIGSENVITVDANPRSIPIIQKNLQDNAHSKAKVIHGAVIESPKDKVVDFFIPESFWSAALTEPEGQFISRVSVPILDFNDLINKYQPTVLIIDVEGEERNYFRLDIPSRTRLIILELHPKKYPAIIIGDIFQRLAAQRFFYQPRGSHGAVVVFEKSE